MLRKAPACFSFVNGAAACMIVFPLLVIGFLLLLKFFPVDITSVEEGLSFLNRKRWRPEKSDITR
jgi:sodium-dependent dicarboxylate transporter 2/3/5